MSKEKVLFIRINDEYYIGMTLRDDDYDEFSKLMTVMQANEKIGKILEGIADRWFKGKYYSTPKNYYAILERADVSPSEYVKAIEIFESIGLLIKEEERVYSLGENYYLMTQVEIDAL